MGSTSCPSTFTTIERLPQHEGLIGRYGRLTVWLRTHVVVASLLILVCSLGPRLLFTALADVRDLVKPDSSSYLAPALSLIKHGTFLNGKQEPEVTRTPGYPAFLTGILAVVGQELAGQDLKEALLVQTVILSGGVVVLYWLARRILPPVMAFTGALLAAVSPWGAVLAGFALTEGLFICVLAMIFLMVKVVEDAKTLARAVWGSAAVGGLTAWAVLIRPLWPLVLMVGAALVFHYGPRRKAAWLVVAVMLVCASTPLFLWKARNYHEADFNGLSNIAGETTWRWLASRVMAEVNGLDRFEVQNSAIWDDRKWNLSLQHADDEHWRRANAVFREHPVLTGYSFLLSAVEHAVHPSPDILSPARLSFAGDYAVLAVLWGGMLVLAYLGWRSASDPEWDQGEIDHGWLLTLAGIGLLLTLASGVSFGQGSRLRAPLELIVPLLAGVGLVRIIRSLHNIPVHEASESKAPRRAAAEPVLAVLIPVYNEIHSIEALIQRVLSAPVPLALRLFVVDDHSTDGSGALLDRLAASEERLTVLHHSVNRGKGAAIRTAIAAAEGDFAIIQDADFEYDPNDYPRIVAPLLRGDAEAVFGSRYLNGSERRALGYWHSVGNTMLTTAFNIVHNLHLTDMETCYKAMPLALLKNLRLTCDRFGIEPEIPARLIALRARIIEVPISYSPRAYQDGKKIGWRDAIEALYLIIKFKYFDVVPCLDAGMVRHLAMAGAPHYQHTVARAVHPFLGERVLEVGAGIGNMARRLPRGIQLILAEPVSEYRRQLTASLSYRSQTIITDHDVFTADGARWAKRIQPDTILCVNQLEEAQDDKVALDAVASALAPGGRVVLLVSAQECLYGSLDAALRRRRRYRAETIVALARAAGLEIEHHQSLGKLALIGWFLEGKVWRRPFFAPRSVAWLDLLSSLLGRLDRYLPWNGLSLLIIAHKPV